MATALYVTLGKPGLHDEPYARRIDAWKQADPRQLNYGELAAVLQTVVKERPNDAQPLTYLAQAQAASGNVPAAVESIRKALRLQPNDDGLWSALGQLLLLEGQGEVTQPAQAAFRQAVKLNPKEALGRYYLARARIAGGDVNGGLNDWRALAADLPADERPQLEQEIDATDKAGHLVVPPKAQPEPQQQQQAEAGNGAEALAGALTGQEPPRGAGSAPDPRQMVAQLAAKLEQDPNDLPGWARLIRSYAVLGAPDKMKQAEDRARQIFKGQPEALKTIDNAASAPQGSE
jgi:cytochrome c-type biogenesis protein CcmH